MSAYRHLEFLVNRCGDRRVGTLGNRKAAGYIARVMSEAGFECRGQPFVTPPGIQAPNAATLMMGFISSLFLSRLGKPARALGLAASALMAASVLGENSTLVQPAHYLVRRREGGNVIASPAGSPAPAVLVVAHFDTVNEGSAFNTRWVGLVRAGLYAYATFPVLAVLLSIPRRRWPARLFRLGMLAGAAGMVQWQLLGKYNAGANDNGTGVSVALAAAERMGGGRARAGDPWFLFTDGEEAGITGMRAFLKEYGSGLRRTAIVNLESLGSGRLSLLGREGMLLRFKPPDELIGLVEDCAAGSGIDLERHLDPAFTTDALAALARGYAAVTLTRLDSNGLIPGWHYRDHLEDVDRESLEETCEFVARLAEFLCAELNRY